jgi:hypothetical protein
MSDNANFNEENTRIVCELFAKQVKVHTTHLNMIVYKNLMEKFKDKKDKMRTDHAKWKRLTKESGIE